MTEENIDSVGDAHHAGSTVAETPAAIEPVSVEGVVPELRLSVEQEVAPPAAREVLQEPAQGTAQEAVTESVLVDSDSPSTDSPEKTTSVVQESSVDIPAPQSPQTIIQKIIYTPTKEMMHKLLVLARAETQRRKQKKLDKIMRFFEIRQKITNKDIQKLLIVSNDTVVRYMDILEQEGKVKQEGTTGQAVYYRKII